MNDRMDFYQSVDGAQINKLRAENRRLAAEVEALRKDAERYQIVRRMNVQQFHDLYSLNISAGKPFDEIVDDLKPFWRSGKRA